MDRQQLIEKSIEELKDVAYSLKTQQIVQELESKHLKQSIDEVKKLIEKETERREKKEQENKSSAVSIKVSLISGILGFITATVVAVISLLKG